MTLVQAADSRLEEALAHAGREIIEDRDGSLQMDIGSREEIERLVPGVIEAIRRSLAGSDPEPLPRTHLSRRILQALRTRFLQHVADITPRPDPESLLASLQGFETVVALVETDWRKRFSDRLSGPDGLELVVEVAHDLRSPLTSILFLAETLRRGRSGPLTPVQERQLGLIYAAAFGLTSVASDVIELARGGDRQLELDPLPFSVADILESVRDIVQPIAEEKGLEVRLETDEKSLRMGYPVALSRVLLNLTTNALKFTDEGHVDVTAEVRDGGRMEFSVKDTGRGIPPNSMAMLYEPFRRRQRDREYAFSGSGLGLSICRKLVEAMASELRVETGPGQGTRFSFVLALPLVDSDSEMLR